MDKDFLIIEIIFICSLFVNVFIQEHLSIKILIVFLLFLYILKSIPKYVYNKSKFIFISSGLLIFSILFIVVSYFSNIYFITGLFSLFVIFLYLKFILFRYSYGEVIKKNKSQIHVKVKDPFYDRKKTVILTTKKAVAINDIVIFSLKNPFLQKSSQKVISIRKP